MRTISMSSARCWAKKVAAAGFVVAISEFNRRMLIDLYGSIAAERVMVVHCGIDPTLFRPREQRDSREPFTIVCVGSLAGYKGQRYLIDACARLRDRRIPFRCLLVGEGDDRPRLEEQIRQLELEQQVTLMGALPRHRVSEVVRQADVVALPSVVMPNGKMEGIPMALMEALASEVPVVATSISGIPELVHDGETGLLVPQRDAAALADALARCTPTGHWGGGWRRLAGDWCCRNLISNAVRSSCVTCLSVTGARRNSVGLCNPSRHRDADRFSISSAARSARPSASRDWRRHRVPDPPGGESGGGRVSRGGRIGRRGMAQAHYRVHAIL